MTTRTGTIPRGEPRTPSALAYIVGNTAVLLVGFLSAYAALRFGRIVSPEVLSTRTVDFLQYFSAGHFVLNGHPADMYQWNPMLAEQQAISYPYRMPLDVMEAFLIYPPFTGLIFAPFAALPYDLARLLWFALSCASLVSALYLLERIMGLTGRASFLLRLATFIFLPVFQSLYQGQVSVFLLLALVGAFVLTTRNNHLMAGACLAVLTVKPQYLAPILLVMLVRRQWRTLASFCASTLVLFAIPSIILGPSTTGWYLHQMIDIPNWGQHTGMMLSGTSESLYGLTHAVLSGHLATAAWAAASGIVLLLLVGYALWSPGLDTPFALAVVAGLLISPHLLLYDLTLLLLPAAVAVRDARLRGMRIGIPIAVLYGAITLTIPLGLVMPVRLSTFAMAFLALLLVYVAGPRAGRVVSPTDTAERAMPGQMPA